MFDRLEFLLGEALVAMRRNFLMTFAAISTAAVALFLLGGLAYIYLRVSQFASDVSGKFEMRVWLKEKPADANGPAITFTAKDIPPIISRIRAVKGVKTAVWVPKEKEWEKMKQDDPRMTQGIEINPLGQSFKVVLSDLSVAGSVEDEISGMKEVEDVLYLKDEQEMTDQALGFVRWMGGGLGSILIITAAILIYNAIRLTILARRREIRIMQLVGASKFTVRTPFLIEGLIQGAVGGTIAALLIRAAQSVIERQTEAMHFTMHIPTFPTGFAIALLATIGGLFGMLCSYLAIREPLRYRSGANI